MTGAGTVHAAPQQPWAGAAPSDGSQWQAPNPSQSLTENLNHLDAGSDSTAVFQLQHHQSSTDNVTASTNQDQTFPPLREIMSNGSLHCSSPSARRLFQLAVGAAEKAHREDNRVGISDPLRSSFAADESGKQPLLDSPKHGPDRVRFWTRLWSSLRGRVCLLSCSSTVLLRIHVFFHLAKLALSWSLPQSWCLCFSLVMANPTCLSR